MRHNGQALPPCIQWRQCSVRPRSFHGFQSQKAMGRKGMYKDVRLGSYWVALWRKWWNLCPECNSDAPYRDTCPVCNCGDTPREVWWIRYKSRRRIIRSLNVA